MRASGVRFVVVYQREPHARQLAFGDVPQPKDFAERAALARKALAELKLDVEVWIDDEGDQSRAMFGDLPHSAIVLDPAGTVRIKQSWCDPAALGQLLSEVPKAPAGERIEPRAGRFLKRLSGPRPPHVKDDVWRFHRDVMMCSLLEQHPDHADRDRWIQELEGRGPAQQQAWLACQRTRVARRGGALR